MIVAADTLCVFLHFRTPLINGVVFMYCIMDLSKGATVKRKVRLSYALKDKG